MFVTPVDGFGGYRGPRGRAPACDAPIRASEGLVSSITIFHFLTPPAHCLYDMGPD
jgi:hypothetical protein